MSATAQLALDVRGFLAGVDLAKQGLTSLRSESVKVDQGSGMARLQVAAIALGASLAGLSVAVYKGVTSTVELGARLVDVSYKSGLAVQQIMLLERSMDEVGGKAEEAAPATDKFNQAIQQAANNAGPLVSILKSVNLTMEQLAGMTVAQRMVAVGNAIRSIANPAQQAEAAVSAFGASGIKMLAALDPKNLNSAAAAMGSQAQIMQANAGVFARIMQLMGAQGSSLNSLAVAVKGKLQGLFTGIAAGVAPTILKIMEASSTGGTSLASAIRSFSPALEPLAGLVEALVSMDLAGVGAQLGAGAAAIGEAIMNGDAINYLRAGLTVASAEFREALAGVAGGLKAAFDALTEGVDLGSILTGFETGMMGIGRMFLGLIQQGIGFIISELRNSSKVFKALIPENLGAGLTAKGTENLAGGRGDIASGAEKIANATREAAARLGENVANVPGAFEAGAAAAAAQQQQGTEAAKTAMVEIEAKSKASAQITAAALRAQFATPAKGEQAIALKPAKTESPVASIVSSLARIGGDVRPSQTGAIDLARSQLQAQQETAKNTALIAQKMRSTSSTSSGSQTAIVYQ